MVETNNENIRLNPNAFVPITKQLTEYVYCLGLITEIAHRLNLDIEDIVSTVSKNMPTLTKAYQEETMKLFEEKDPEGFELAKFMSKIMGLDKEQSNEDN